MSWLRRLYSSRGKRSCPEQLRGVSLTRPGWFEGAPRDGMREAVVTAELINDGKLTIQSYESSWARDPYDPSYCGVDRNVLHFISDDECYDERFPEHPLSMIRQVLAKLPGSVKLESLGSGTEGPQARTFVK